jgi:hypothetical protein
MLSDKMKKGFVYFRKGKIPFVIKNYTMELFTDDDILNTFTKEYNFKKNYILNGQCFDMGSRGRVATFLVERSIGSTCYLRCYIINMFASNGEYNSIGLQSPFLDDIFRYKYKYLDMVKDGINLALNPQIVYTIPFEMNDMDYELNYYIGQNHSLGLLEDFDKKGEIVINLHTDSIQEIYDITMVLYRLAMFMMSKADVPFQQITLYKDGHKTGWFYCPMVSEKSVSFEDIFFSEFDVMKYIPKILSNIAIDSGNKITKSIPLGHLGSMDTMFSPQRFLQQVMSFEYLFDKLEHKKAQSSKFPLKDELKYMLDKYPELLSNSKLSSDEASDKIKETRRQIVHGYAYYYDFKNDYEIQYLILLLDKLIRIMSLQWAGFSKENIIGCPLLKFV